ncbi:MAG: hypothetical protein NTU97_00050, partial [Candidatus Magasanikbacteria bacterium]|nr:hypothetical protein [Candidatus Magasanikbacteria bacterium]
MNLDLTIVLPSIRPRNLIKFYKSLQNSCKKYSFELIIASPYLLPEELMTEPSIRFVHTYSSP